MVPCRKHDAEEDVVQCYRHAWRHRRPRRIQRCTFEQVLVPVCAELTHCLLAIADIQCMCDVTAGQAAGSGFDDVIQRYSKWQLFFLTATFFKISKIQNRLLWLDVVRCSVECEVVFLQYYRFVACSKSSVLIYVEVAGTCSNDKSRVSCLDGFSWPRLSQLISFGNSCVSFDCYVQSELRHRDVNTSSCS